MKKMYHNNTRSFALLFILLVFLLGGIVGYGLSIYKFEVSGKIYDSCSMNCPNPDPVIRPNFSISTTCPPPEINITKKCPEPEVKTNCPKCDKGFFKRMIEAQSRNFIYKEDEYDCTQYANDLAGRLKNKGFDAHSDRIRVDCDNKFWQGSNCEKYNGLHKIVKVDLYIEATTGNVIDPQNYEAYNLN